MIKIAKFGGSSVASAEQFRKVKAIVEADPDRRFVVVSAAGKRFSGDNKITDLLLLVNAHIQYHVDCTALLADIEQRFVEIADELGLKWPVHEKFETFARNIKKHSPEYIVARGEWFTAHLMAEYLGLPFVDAADVVVFHHDGNVDMERTAARLKDVMVRKGCFVLPGFYGATVDGQIKLFQRGGGDITGAILARCIDAGLYENWTDVSGFLSADPRIVDHPRSIRRITFDEMRELSYMGASVLQEEAIFPVREVNIPIQIKNTNRPQDEGTIIREKARIGEDEHLITGIAGKRDFISVHVKKAHMSGEVGFVRRALRHLGGAHPHGRRLVLRGGERRRRQGLDLLHRDRHPPRARAGRHHDGGQARAALRRGPQHVQALRHLRQDLRRARRGGREHPHDHAELAGDLHHHGRQQRGLRQCRPGDLRPLRPRRDGHYQLACKGGRANVQRGQSLLHADTVQK